MKKLLISVLALILAMNLAFAFAEYDPVVVRVGELVFTRSQVREAIDLMKQAYETQGTAVTASVEAQIQQEVLKRFVQQGVQENKIKELGLETPNVEEMKELDRQTEQRWEEAVGQAKQELVERYHVTADKLDAYAEVYMDLVGATKDELRKEMGLLWMQDKLTKFVSQDVPRLTDEEVRAWYTENLVLPGKTAYADDIEAFETDVLLNDAVCYYIPGEYRFIQNIVFNAPDEKREECQLRQMDLWDAQEELVRAENALYGVQLLGDDTAGAEAAVEAAQVQVVELAGEVEEMKKAMAQEFAPQIGDIASRLEAGEDFMALREEYDQNTENPENGYMVCADSVIWEASFKEAAMALEKPGDFTGPIYTTSGPQFLLYAGDAPRGALPLSDEDWEAIKQLAQINADNQLLGGFIEQWTKEYEVEIHEELLKL